MSNTKKNKRDEMSEKELPEQTPALNKEMSENELEGIAAAGNVTGNNEDNALYGGAEDDNIYGGNGSDVMFGGDGDDTMDGGYKDGADDVAYGGGGDDAFIWGLSGDGNDTFEGGTGSDSIQLNLASANGTIQTAYDSGAWSIEVFDANGNAVEITDDMWDADGNLNLPGSSSGVITGTNGETLTFSGVEAITTYIFD